jgi:hypothetical protein
VLKSLYRSDADAALEFENELIRTTVAMVGKGLLDTDHRLPNFVVPPEGIPLRIDFELCVPVRLPGLHPHRLGVMLGTFLGSMVFAVQPDTARAAEVARRLFRELRPSGRVRKVAQQTLNGMMERQREEIGMKSELTLEEL